MLDERESLRVFSILEAVVKQASTLLANVGNQFAQVLFHLFGLAFLACEICDQPNTFASHDGISSLSNMVHPKFWVPDQLCHIYLKHFSEKFKFHPQ